MTQPSAIVVTYRPDIATLQALLDALVPQVDRLWLVDNASANMESIRELAATRGISVIANSSNIGVAAALNQGIAAARAAGCDHVLLMDQDSLPASDMVIRLREALQSGGERLAAVGPAHLDARTGQVAPFVRIGFPFNHKTRPAPGEVVDPAQTLLPGGVGGEDSVAFVALGLLRLRSDDFEAALAGEIEQAGGEGGEPEVDIAGHHRDRDRLRRVEKLKLEIEPLLFEVAFLDRNEQRPRRHEPQDADSGLFLRGRGHD